MTFLFLSDNLMFSMPVLETARQLELTTVHASSAAQAQTHLNDPELGAVLLDMRLATRELVQALPAHVAVAAFGPHVEGQMFLDYRKMGIKEVWPNSKLGEKLRPWLERVSRGS